MKKIDLAKRAIEKKIRMFRCPICRQAMLLKDHSLACYGNHLFDLSKNGYINLLGKPVHSKYDKQRMMARKIISRSGFFQETIEKIAEIILELTGQRRESQLTVLDAGCGEGTNLAGLLDILSSRGEQTFPDPAGVGLDISKEGIYLASAEYPGIIWCVGDLVHTPFRNQSFDILLNILSPANYDEFKRILKNDGFLIKVIPETDYLQELRKVLFRDKEKQAYSNEGVLQIFRNQLTLIRQEHIRYTRRIDPENLNSLFVMTPLTWEIDREELNQRENTLIPQVTVDLRILVGKARDL